MKLVFRTALLAALILVRSPPAWAQALPSAPLEFADGRLTVSGEVSGSIAPDDAGFFNYTGYEYSALRLLRLDFTTSLTFSPRLTLLGEVRSDNVNSPRVYALYFRIRPWTNRAFDIQAGRVPLAFGAFARRAYASDNPLIGYPLAYQYLTSLRADALPANADDLLRMRGRGWLSSFPIGNRTAASGLPLIDAFRWDSGVQVHVAGDLADATAAVTVGTLSDPHFVDNNSGGQIAGRLAVHPAPGLLLGVSAARGPFASSAATRDAGTDRNGAFTQTAVGGDVEYSRDYYLVRAETVFSEWRVPAAGAPLIDQPLRALATYAEGRYRIRPGLYVAARVDHIAFSDVTGSLGPQSWDAPVTRFEIGGGYSIRRNVLLKLSCQRNTRDGGRVTRSTLGAAQLVYWF